MKSTFRIKYFFLTVILFDPRETIKSLHEFEVLCKKKSSALNSSLHRISSLMLNVFLARIKHDLATIFFKIVNNL